MREVDVPPEPQLMESMRAVGYTLETALADIVDNSISADASVVDVFFDSEEPDHLAIIDDGHGMCADEIQAAMRLAGRSSIQTRSDHDLGRFGLGLKTASLSQCRKLTVISIQGERLAGYCWSLDHLAQTGRWSLIVLSDDEIRALPRIEHLLQLAHGTMVLWQQLDQLADAPGANAQSLNSALARTRDHLALVFHRYLAGEHGHALAIRVNGIEPGQRDPFLSDHRATQIGPREQFTIDDETVEVKPYTLPYINKLSTADRARADLDKTTLRDSQGFYIYRRLRLVIWGSWFRIVTKEDSGRLSRVKVEIPNSLDDLWSLDIKKSAASPPPAVKAELRRIVQKIVEPSRTAHRYRGRVVSNRDPITRVWNLIEDREGFRYRINRDHPAIRALASNMPDVDLRAMERLLEVVEGTFPVHDAHNRLGVDQTAAQSVDDSAVLEHANAYWQLWNADGKSANDFIDAMRHIEPFCNSRNSIEILTKVTQQ